MEHKTGIIILAAGSSSRLGQPKQLIQFSGKNLLDHVITEAMHLPESVVIVVTGANRKSIEAEISGSGVTFVFNEIWENGMGSSIACGLKKILEIAPDISSCILSVCDHPFISAELFQQLIDERLQSGKGIVASEYGSTLGTPALFNKKYFSNLLTLSGKDGAKKLLFDFEEDVTTVSFEKGIIDIDTPEDYNQLKNYS